MKTVLFRNIIALASTAAITAGASAQNLTESVTVEGRYTPEVIPADRLALLPATISLTAPESPMTYDRTGVVAAFAPDALSMPSTGWRAKKAYDDSMGYVDFRLGSWLNSSLSAGVAAINDDRTRLNVYLQHNSTSLWQAWKGNRNEAAAAKRYRYDETIGADLTHSIEGAGRLSAALQYHLGYFNYYGTREGWQISSDSDGSKAPSQTLNDLYARLGWAGETYGRFSYSAEADVRHFAYRAAYLPVPGDIYSEILMRAKGERETALNVGGTLGYSLGAGSGLGLGLRYSGVLNATGNDVNRFEMTPGYTLSARTYSLRIGANLAVVGNGENTRFRIAPDVAFSARKGLAAFSASVGGGTHLRTLAWRHSMDYYDNPGAGCYEAAYSPLDIKLAFQLNPGGKWTWGVEGLWNTTLDESFGGLYQALLNRDLDLYGTYPETGRIHGFSVAMNAGYEFCRYFGLKGRASWQPQDGSKGILNGFDRPEFTADLSAESRPTDKLSLSLDYHLRAKRLLLPGNLSRLGFSADYNITDMISVGVELDNILNRHEEFLPGLGLEGFNAMGGVSFKF